MRRTSMGCADAGMRSSTSRSARGRWRWVLIWATSAREHCRSGRERSLRTEARCSYRHRADAVWAGSRKSGDRPPPRRYSWPRGPGSHNRGNLGPCLPCPRCKSAAVSRHSDESTSNISGLAEATYGGCARIDAGETGDDLLPVCHHALRCRRDGASQDTRKASVVPTYPRPLPAAATLLSATSNAWDTCMHHATRCAADGRACSTVGLDDCSFILMIEVTLLGTPKAL